MQIEILPQERESARIGTRAWAHLGRTWHATCPIPRWQIGVDRSRAYVAGDAALRRPGAWSVSMMAVHEVAKHYGVADAFETVPTAARAVL